MMSKLTWKTLRRAIADMTTEEKLKPIRCITMADDDHYLDESFIVTDISDVIDVDTNESNGVALVIAPSEDKTNPNISKRRCLIRWVRRKTKPGKGRSKPIGCVVALDANRIGWSAWHSHDQKKTAPTRFRWSREKALQIAINRAKKGKWSHKPTRECEKAMKLMKERAAKYFQTEHAE